jgi:hypothetical protein
MDEERRIEISMCLFCPLTLDGKVCLPYQAIIENPSRKPGHCQYKAIIVGTDHGDEEKG